MLIKLNRYIYEKTYTIGSLFIDNQFFCNTLEDTCREYVYTGGYQKVFEKVWGRTAIHSGNYPVVITYSNKFKKALPLIQNVDGFKGIRIHAGNRASDTAGCILVGSYKEGDSFITNSADTLKRVQASIQLAIDNGEEVTIRILNKD